MHIRYVLGFVIGLSVVHPLSAGAATPPPVIISEIQWAGSARSTADEWIELFNTTGSDINIGGWFLTGIGTSDSAIVLADSTMLSAGGTVVIANYELGNEKTTLAISPTLITSSVSIPNSALDIVLAQPDGLVVDEVHDAGEPDYGSKITFASMERDPNTLDWMTATTSAGLLDGQLGSPGLVQAAVTASTEPEAPMATEPIESEPEVAPSTEPIPEITEPIEPEQEAPPPQEPVPEVTEPVEEPAEPPLLEEEMPAAEEEPVDDQEEAPPDVLTPDAPIEVVPIEAEEVPPVVEPTSEPVIEPLPEPLALLRLSEILSSPDDGDEWVEIYNPEHRNIDLADWMLKEGSGKRTPLAGTIPALGYVIVKNPQGKLNNIGDQLQLLAPDGTVTSSVHYGTSNVPAPKAGEAVAWDELIWKITTSPSPAAANSFPDPIVTAVPLENSLEAEPYVRPPTPEDVPAPSAGVPQISDGASAPQTDAPDDLVAYVATPVVTKPTSTPKSAGTTKKSTASSTPLTEVTGVIVALPGTFGSQIAFLNGHELYFNKAEWPAFALGDEIRVRGTTSTKDGQRRLKISNASDITVTGSASILPSDNDIVHQPHGSLVTIEGTIVSREGTKIQIETPEGVIEAAADMDTDVRWSTFGAERIRVTGILRRTSSSYAVWPRSSSDIERLEQTTALSPGASTPTPAQKPWLGLSLLAGSSATLGGWYLRHKLHQRKSLAYEQRAKLVHVT